MTSYNGACPLQPRDNERVLCRGKILELRVAPSGRQSGYVERLFVCHRDAERRPPLATGKQCISRFCRVLCAVELADNDCVDPLVGDGGEQFGRAVNIVENNEVSIALTVVLETEWVLRDAYEYSHEDVLAAFQKVFGLPTVTVKDQQIVTRAMNFMAAGLDFADALHLVQAGDCEAFVTFDKRLVRKAKGLTETPARPG